MTRVLQISADRSKRGILQHGSSAYLRQEAYAEKFGNLEVIAFSLASDKADEIEAGPLHIIPTSSSSKWFYGWNALQIARTLQKPDVVSAQDPFETGLVAWRIARRFGVPLHIQIHTDFLSPAYAKHSLLNRIRVRIARFVLARADGVRIVSNRIKDSLTTAKYQPKTVPTVLPIFADIERLRRLTAPASLQARFERFQWCVLVISRLEPEKNVALAIEAFVRSAPQEACLIIVGDGSERANLEIMARSRGVGERVFFETNVEAAPYYALADIVLVTSLYEGYGLVIEEALGLGLPVLATDVGAARELGAQVVRPEEFPAALRAWFLNGARTGELKQHPYRSFEDYVEKYCADIERCAKKTIAGIE